MGQVSRSTNLAYTWRVEMKKEKGIKEGGANRKEDRRKREKNTVTPRTNFVIKLERNIKELISSDCAEDDFLQYKPI